MRRRLGVIRATVLLMWGLSLGGVVSAREQTGPFAAQITQALRAFLTVAHTWTATQIFQNVTINGSCTGCGTGSVPWSSITGTPTTLSGYGITDPIVLTSGSYANPSWVTSLAWSKVSSTPTTFAGYGIVDTASNLSTAIGGQTSGTGNFARVTSPSFTTPALGTPSAVVLTNGTGLPWSSVSTTPTTFAGYGISDTAANLMTALGIAHLPVVDGGTGSGTITGLVLGNGTSAMSAYGGASGCATGQAVTAISTAGATTCTQQGIVQLAQVTTSGSQATVDFASIPSGYSTLKVEWCAQDTTASNSLVDLMLKVNADATAADYTAGSRIGSQNGASFAGSVASTTSGVESGSLPEASNTGIEGCGEIILIGYAGTTFHKRVVSTWGEDDAAHSTAGTIISATWRWKSTSAINELTFSSAGTAFTNGSVFTVYGLQ